MEWLIKIREALFGGNSIWQLAAPFVALLIGLIAGRIAQFAMMRSVKLMAQMNRHMASATLRALAGVVTFAGFILGLKVGVLFLTLSESVDSMLTTTINVLISLAVGYAAYCLVDVVDQWLARFTKSDSVRMSTMVRPVVRASLRITVVILILLQIAQLLTDKPLTSIIAGLGVGGLAIALAAQETVKNFFGSLVIFADAPFQLGERISIDGFDGFVEEVGLRSTRIRTLQGHLVTVPNGELANKTIENVGRRPHIRRLTNIALSRNTSPEKMRRALEILKELLNNHEGMKPEFPPRVAFNELPSTAATALNILVIYWYHPPDYWKFMDFTERFNFQVLERFSAEGIEFAYPTQAIQMLSDASVSAPSP